MRKLSAPHPRSVLPVRRRWCTSLVRAVGLGLCAALVCELLHWSVLAWQAVGRHESVVFDSLLYQAARALVGAARSEAAHLMAPWLHDPSWKPNWTIPIAIGWAAAAGWFLRSGRR
jgi:hypothetical protein